MRVLTVGDGAREAGELIGCVQADGVRTLVGVRRYPELDDGCVAGGARPRAGPSVTAACTCAASSSREPTYDGIDAAADRTEASARAGR
ncbi:MAG TPA: hypothetical protein VFA44_15450 [Gaiellaceae bacterium]|nr:hypothetical protein [Gaiellaceae bacterium]